MKIEKNKLGNWELTATQKLSMEGSFGNNPVGEHEYTMELYTDDDGTPTGIEWDVPDLDLVEFIGLEFDGLELVGYDGVMSFPKEAAELIRKVGYKVGDDFLD